MAGDGVGSRPAKWGLCAPRWPTPAKPPASPRCSGRQAPRAPDRAGPNARADGAPSTASGPSRDAPPIKRPAKASKSCGSTSPPVASAWTWPWITEPEPTFSDGPGRPSATCRSAKPAAMPGWRAPSAVPHATRAVGRAVGSSPNLIFVPCHRIVGSRGLGGYARGTGVKQQLLDHESGLAAHAANARHLGTALRTQPPAIAVS